MDPGDLRDAVQDEARGAEDDDRDHRADRLLGQGRDEQAYRAQGREAQPEVDRRQQHPEQSLREPDLRPGQQRHAAAAEQCQPHHDTGQRHGQGRHDGEDDDREVLHAEQSGALDGHRQQVAQGADVRLAGHRVARDRGDGERQEESELESERGERDEEAVLGDGVEEVRAAPVVAATTRASPPPRSGPGTDASTSSPAWLRRRRKISRSSERRNRVESVRGRRTSIVSAADIEAFSGQGHEHVLQRGGRDPEPDHRHALVHAGGDDLLR